MTVRTRGAKTFTDVPIGDMSRRLHGARAQLLNRAASARAASEAATDDRAAAALRGKACGLLEAADVLAALELGRRIPQRPVRRRRWWGAA